MLEHSDLLIGPWQACASDPTGRGRRGAFCRRDIVVAEGRKLAGFACRQRRRLSWLIRRPVEVCETEDASLLATVWPPGWFSRTWEVYDAENRCRGLVDRAWLLDGSGQS